MSSWPGSPAAGLHYSIGMTITEDMQQAILQLPGRIWEPAYDAGGTVRPGAWVAELTGLLYLSSRPEGIRIIVPEGTPPSWRAAALHRYRWAPVHLLRYRHQDRTAR